MKEDFKEPENAKTLMTSAGDRATEIKTMPENEFHIGITMAGAASAGCYTGGAMDYLFEVLELWENAKKGQLPDGLDEDILALVPPHKVIIDVMGGTSAGGMTTAMAALYAMKGKINPVVDPKNLGNKKDNLFYDSWVFMGDKNEAGSEKILQKTLDTGDLEISGKIMSLLNSSFIDAIAEEAFKCEGTLEKCMDCLPGYISPELEVLISHTMLRGVPLNIEFTTPIGQLRKTNQNPTHSTYEHFTISHFKLNGGSQPRMGEYLWLNPYDPASLSLLKLAVKATGAFPVGLQYREFGPSDLSSDYIKSVTGRIVSRNFDESDLDKKIKISWPSDFPKSFEFVTVDGGAINNEPFGEVLSVLKSKWGEKAEGADYRYGIIMIDPFPDRFDGSQQYKQPSDLFDVVPQIIATLWDQSKVKRADLLEAYSSDYYRGVIFPVKWEGADDSPKYKNLYPIACDAAMAFGGFLDIKFRHHDFFLGRDNTRNFLRFYFSLPYDPDKGIVHPIHKTWSPEMVNVFIIKRDGKAFLPIIPDLNMLKDFVKDKRPNPYEHTVKLMPKYNPRELFALRGDFKKRAEKMLNLAFDKMSSTSKTRTHPKAQQWMDVYFKSSWWKRFKGQLGSWIIEILFRWNKSKLASNISRSAIFWVLKDLEKKGLI
jgi:hypothetical protein